MYEMLTGRRAFDGEDVSDTLAGVLRDEPDWTALPAKLSPGIAALIQGCLRKDPRRRIGDISTAKFIIDYGDPDAAIAAPSASKAPSLVWVVTGAIAIAIAAYAGSRFASEPPRALAVARFTIALPPGDRFSNTGVHAVALSEDGTRLVYAANGRLYLRRMDRVDATPIRGTEGVDQDAGRSPFLSPDGRWIGFWQGGRIKKVSVDGGAPLVVCAAENPFAISWTTDDTILYGQSEPGAGKGAAGIWRVSSGGGTPEHLVKLGPDEIAEGPQMLQSGRSILFTLARHGNWDTAQIVVHSLDTGNRRVVLDRGTDAQYVATGHLVYALDGTLFAVPFDTTKLAVTGTAVPLANDVAQQNVAAQFALSKQGVLVYLPRDAVGPGRVLRTLVWIDRQGREDPLKAPIHAYFHPRLSPDGTRAALELRDQEHDIWIWDLARETLTRLTLAPTFEQYPVWMPDGRTIIFTSAELGGPQAPRSLFRRPSDGTGAAEELTQRVVPQFPSAATPDGTAVIYRQQTIPTAMLPAGRTAAGGATTGMDLFLLPLEGDRRPRPLLQTPFDELNGEVSPDGRWLAYQSNESGRHEIYVRPFPNVDAGKKLVSTSGGTQPTWARNGRELFFQSDRALMHVAVTTGSTFEASTAARLFDVSYSDVTPGRMYDVAADGRRFLLVKDARDADVRVSPRVILVQNWLEELKRAAPKQ